MRSTFHGIFAIVLVIGSVLLAADSAWACSCRGSTTIDEAFEMVPNIAVLKVESVKKYEAGEPGYSSFLPNRIKESRLRVVRVFKGNLQLGQELLFGEGSSGACTYTFGENSIGRESLLFLSSQPTSGNYWEAGYCIRQSSLAAEYTDLAYLNELEKVKGKTRISGMVIQFTHSAIEDVPGTSRVFADRIVRVIGNSKEIELRTDKNGVFEVYDLPPGKYELITDGVEGYRLSPRNMPVIFQLPSNGQDRPVVVEIKPGKHVEVDLVFEIDNSISGKLLDADGKPFERVLVELKPAKGKEYRYFYNGGRTDRDGSFHFTKIPPGEYVIVVNENGWISGDTPFGTFYYPDKAKIADTGGLSVGAGQHVKDLKLVPPSTAETITVSGSVSFENLPDDPTFRHLYVKARFEPVVIDSKSGNQVFSLETFLDRDGKFSLRVLKGQKGRLFLTEGLSSLLRNECPNLNLDSGKPLSQTVEIEGNKDVGNIELKAQLPGCQKAKIN